MAELALLASVFSDSSPKWRAQHVHAWKWYAAAIISVTQLICIFAVLFAEPLTHIRSYDLMAATQTLSSLVQGIAVAAIGAVIFDGR